MKDVRTDDAGFRVSFELFPPKTEDALPKFDDVVDQLLSVGPEYFSVTYGAGGTTRDRTRGCVERVRERTGLPVSHHLTCVEASREEIDDLARDLWESGIRKLVALRGDPVGGGTYTPPANGYPYAAELVAGLRRVADFDIAVGAYPEKHPEAFSEESDLDNLKRKVDAGATSAITQYVFDTETVLRFVDRARAAGITVPIIPGIMPVSHFGGLKRFSEKCGASIPDWMSEMFEGRDADPEMRAMVATTIATEQCRRFLAEGIDEFHIYTLNKATVPLAICRALGLNADPAQSAA
ncbi:MAG: methylenetetrahydrofolate reductase [NAD(P)H] [Paracoccaceae bacterium]